MPATGTAAYGMYTENASLPDIICTLSHAGFDKADICMVPPGSPATPPGSTADTSRQYGYSAGGHDDSAGYAAESNYAWIHESEWSSELYVANDDSPTGRGAGQYDSAFHNQPKFNESERNAGWLPLYASRYDSGHDAEYWVFELIS